MPTCERYELILHAYRQGMTIDELHELTRVPHFFLAELRDIVELEDEVRAAAGALERAAAAAHEALRVLRPAPRRALGSAGGARSAPCGIEHGIVPVYKAVDTCAAEFEAETPYFYSTYEDENEARPGERERSSSSAAGPTASARASSSTTAACTPP